METYIVIQMIVINLRMANGREGIGMDCIVRKVQATSQAEAIGKFALSTQDIKPDKKLDIQCYKLSDLKSIE